MKTLILLFSHTLTPTQERDAEQSLGIDTFVALPEELQKLWSSVPPDMESLAEYLSPIREFVAEVSSEGDAVLIQGDFGATYHLVSYALSLGLTPLYATTKRDVVEIREGDSVVKRSVSEHVRFRVYA